LRAAHPEKADAIRVVWTSPLIPNDPFVWRKDLPDLLKQRIAAFFLAYGVDAPTGNLEHERAVLAGLKWQRIVRSTNEQLIPTRQVDLFTARAKIESDETLGPDERRRQLGEIDEKLKALQALAGG